MDGPQLLLGSSDSKTISQKCAGCMNHPLPPPARVWVSGETRPPAWRFVGQFQDRAAKGHGRVTDDVYTSFQI